MLETEARVQMSRDEATGRFVVRLYGDWDMSCAMLLTDALATCPDCDCTVDLRHATFVDSTILRELVRLRTTLDRNGRHLETHVSPGPVARLIDVTSLQAVLNVLPPPVRLPAYQA